MVENFYMLSDTEIVKKISARLKETRLRQNISRQDLADSSGVSVSSIVRMEDGEIKSFVSFKNIENLGENGYSYTFGGGRGIEPERIFQCCAGSKSKDSQASFQKQ